MTRSKSRNALSKILIASVLTFWLIAVPATSSSQTSGEDSITLPTGEVVTAREFQDFLNDTNKLADLYENSEARNAEKDTQILLLQDANANLIEQVKLYQATVEAYVQAVAALKDAIAAHKEAEAARDKKIEILEKRVKELENRKTRLWQKILLGAATIIIAGKVL